MRFQASHSEILVSVLVVFGAAVVCISLWAPHKPTKPGMLIVGEMRQPCLDHTVMPGGAITVTTFPERGIITIHEGWLFVDAASK